MKKRRSTADDLRGVGRLAVDATHRVTDIVETMHLTIASGPELLGRPFALPARWLTALTYRTIEGVTWAVGAGLDLSLSQLESVLGSSAPGPDREAVIAALNGVVGDYLLETRNPLAIELSLRRNGVELGALGEGLPTAALEAAGRQLVVWVHGSSMNDLQWRRGGHDHGAALERDLGVTSVYAHYNSGLHISTNGGALADAIEGLVARWPVALERVVIVGFSMGGLVARSAVHAAEERGHAWRSRLDTLITLGSPHHGAPLEQGGSWVDVLLATTPYSAPIGRLGKLRSAGITDMRFGNVLDAHWRGRDRFDFGCDDREPLPLPEGVRCFAMAATLSETPASVPSPSPSAAPASAPSPSPSAKGALRGDGLVSIASALGRHERPALTLDFEKEHLVFGCGHLDLLANREAYRTLLAWLGGDA